MQLSLYIYILINVDFIVKSGHYTTTINNKRRRVAIGLSISKGDKIEQSDTLFDSSPLDGNTIVAGTLPSSGNHLLNSFQQEMYSKYRC